MIINKEWDNILKNEYSKEYFLNLTSFIDNEYLNKDIYPKKENIFKAFHLTSFNNIKVVIIGQDPYHGIDEAIGLAFSVNKNQKTPPSLKNIFKELESDLKIVRTNSDLEDWAKQGVLLLNNCLTVERDKPASHQNMGWEIFVNEVISQINQNKEHVVFILWGKAAAEKEKIIDQNRHYIIKSSHPSPFSYKKGFEGSKPFSKTNNYLVNNNIKPINW